MKTIFKGIILIGFFTVLLANIDSIQSTLIEKYNAIALKLADYNTSHIACLGH